MASDAPKTEKTRIDAGTDPKAAVKAGGGAKNVSQAAKVDAAKAATQNADTAIAAVQAAKPGTAKAVDVTKTSKVKRGAAKGKSPKPVRKAAKAAAEKTVQPPAGNPAPAKAAKIDSDTKMTSATSRELAAAKPPQERITQMVEDKKTPTEAMQAQAETAVQQSKVAFEDMAAKSKSAMEKNVKTMEEMGSFARGNVEAVVEAGKIYAEGAQDMARKTADFAKAQAEKTTATMQNMSSVKNPNEVVELQGKYVRGQFDAMVAHNSAMTEQMLKLAGDVMAPFQNRMAIAMQKFSKVA